LVVAATPARAALWKSDDQFFLSPPSHPFLFLAVAANQAALAGLPRRSTPTERKLRRAL